MRRSAPGPPPIVTNVALAALAKLAEHVYDGGGPPADTCKLN